ncbi:MAG: leucine-rich repeat domain-containing protein [Planctomycetota bacterium]
MNSSLRTHGVRVGLMIGLVFLFGCAERKTDRAGDGNGDQGADQSVERPEGSDDTGVAKSEVKAAKQPARVSTAKSEQVMAAQERLEAMGGDADYKLVPDGVITEIVVEDGSVLSAEDLELFGKLTDLETLRIFDFRELDNEMVAKLTALSQLKELALRNTAIGDSGVELIAESFPDLRNLDLSYNPSLGNSAMKAVSQLTNLEVLTLIQNRFNDLGISHLMKLENLRVVDIRGNMQAGDLALEFLSALPNLTVLKHRSTIVSDAGIAALAASPSLKSLLMHDFLISNEAGESLADMEKLTELEIFRCENFGSDGVLALKGMPLTRLKLRGLPAVDNRAMAVFEDLPALERLSLHEIGSLGDDGLQSLGNLKTLKVLDVWDLPAMTDATVEVIATLPELKELSIRGTSVTGAAVDTLVGMPKLHTLVFKDNGTVAQEELQKLAGEDWRKLDIGQELP